MANPPQSGDAFDHAAASQRKRAFTWAIAVAAIGAALALCTGAAVLATHGKRDLASTLGYGVQPATQSLLAGNGLTICSDDLAKTPGSGLCFHSARMPMAEWAMAAGIRTMGARLGSVSLSKIAVFLMPLAAAVFFVANGCSHKAKRPKLLAAILLSPFLMVPFLMDVVRLDYEEAYSYGFIALAFAVALFVNRRHATPQNSAYGLAVLAGVCVAGIYLSKSSMILLAACFLLVCVYKVRGAGPRLLLLLLALAAPGGWSLYQHHAGGRYSLGTSLDGFNLHMGNSEHFLRDYPPAAGVTLDDTAVELNAGHRFADEWAFNDFHTQAAKVFVRDHPAQAANGELRKLRTIFFSVREVGTYKDRGLFALATAGGILLFRLMFWSALVLSMWAVVGGEGERRETGAVFLVFVGAIVLPYALGFAYTRHLSVLMYPTAIVWCRMLGNGERPVSRIHARL